VAEAPIGALLARVDELARRWAIALILERPLERMAEVRLEMVAHEAPALCAQIIRSLESDTELERLAGGDAGDGRGDPSPARRLVALAGTGEAPAAVEIVEAVELLRGVLWEALLEELRWPISDRSRARQAADLADRLASVCAAALAAAVAAAEGGEEAVPPQSERTAHGQAGGAAGEPRRSPAAQRGAILIDEREQADTAPAGSGDTAPRSPAVEQGQVRPRPWDASARKAVTTTAASAALAPGTGAEVVDEPDGPVAPDRPLAPDGIVAPDGIEAPDGIVAPAGIEVRDERGEEGPAAWIGSIGRQLERFERDQLPFAVVLVELSDSERLRRTALPGAMSSLTSRIERALTEELQRIGGQRAQRRGWSDGALSCERPGRYWLLAPETDAVAARRLAEWVVHTIGPLAGPRWAPLEVLVGIAVCPDDGREAAELAAHADLGLYALRPAGN
jgi:hypothetical protein